MKTVCKFCRSEHGNASMQTVLIMAVGALILISLRGLFNHVSPTVKGHIAAVLAGNPGTIRPTAPQRTPSGTTGSLPNQEEGSDSTKPEDAAAGDHEQAIGNLPAAPPQKDEKGTMSEVREKLPKLVADFAERYRKEYAQELQRHLELTFPNEAAEFAALIDEVKEKLAQSVPGSEMAEKLENQLAGLIKLKDEDLKAIADTIQGEVDNQTALTPVLGSLGRAIGFDQMISQDAKSQALGRNPNATPEELYNAWKETFKISGGMFVDALIDKATGGGTKGGRVSQALNRLDVQIGIGLAADRASEAMAERLFPVVNDFSHWLYDNGYSDRPPRFPRDWQPLKK